MTAVFRNENGRTSILRLVILIGICLRFIPGLQTDFPINDGGMFLSMIRDLRASGFLLPETASYNLSNIPYAYPPFGFYVAALVSSAFPVSEIELLRWIPAAVSAAILPVFYWLSLQFFGKTPRSFLAVVLVSFLPGSFDWLVMGGGLSRSFGILFLLAAAGRVLRLFRDQDARSLRLAILFGALAVLSHPEAGLQTVGICFLIWLLYGRNRAGVLNAMRVSLGAAALTAPWWITVLAYHGFAPFASAMQTGIHERFLPSLFHSFFSLQGGLPLLPVLSLLGLFVTLRRREYLLFGWAFLPFVLDPRNAPAVAQYAYILLSSEGLYFLWEEFDRAYAGSVRGNVSRSRAPVLGGILLAVLGTYLFWFAFASARDLGRVSLKENDRETMEWIRLNTPTGARFLLMTNAGRISPMTDAYQEWFPALAGRQSRNTLQGMEWLLGGEFYEYSLRLTELQSCGNVACMEKWASDNDVRVEYLLVRKPRVMPELPGALQAEAGFEAVYETADTVIYRVEP